MSLKKQKEDEDLVCAPATPRSLNYGAKIDSLDTTQSGIESNDSRGRSSCQSGDVLLFAAGWLVSVGATYLLVATAP